MAENLTRGFLANLNNDGRQSMATYLVAAGLLVTAFLFHKVSSSHVDSREPSLLKPTIPIIGHLIGLIRYQTGYLKMLYDESRLPIATLPILGGKLYAIFDPQLIQAAYRNKNLRFEQFASEFAKREVGISDESEKIVKETNLVPDFFANLRPAMAGQHLHQMNANALNWISGRLREISNDGESEKIPNLYLWCRDLMTEATTEALYGLENPFRGRPSLLKDIWAFEGGLTMLMANIFPSVTASVPYKARQRVQDALRVYYTANNDRHDDVAQVIKTRAETLRSYAISQYEVGTFEIAMLHVATANTIPTLYWFVAHIFSRPDLVSRLRDEALPVAQHGANNEVTVNIKTLEAECPLLVSCYREAIRISNQNVGNRRVVEDTVLSDGKGDSYLLKKGINVQMPGVVTHNLKSVWGENVLEFDPERFLEKDGEAEKAKRAAFAPFGGGRHLCPGRHFALAENLGFVVALLLGFDVLPLDDATEMKLPAVQGCTFAQVAAKPVNNGEGLGIRIRKKQGWELTKWLFVA